MVDIKTRLTKAKVSVMLKSPFFSYKLLHMPVVIDSSIKTACTDGKWIRVNEEFAKGLQDSELAGILAHESCHTLFGHHLRVGNRDGKKANMAMDYAINPLLQKSGFVLPDSALVNDAYDNMAWERIYDSLPDSPDDGKDGSDERDNGNDPGGCGGVEQPKGTQGQQPSESEIEQAEAECKQQLAAAYHAAKMAGKLPAGLERLIQEMLEPKVNWREQLNEYLKEIIGRSDYTWKTPNRRYAHSGFMLPSLAHDKGGTIAVFVDTSGSIGEKELSEFAGEINSIVSECNLDTHVIYCDTEVSGHEFFEAGDTIDLHPMGGGGTQFDAPFKFVEDEGIDAAACVYLTDGYGSCSLDSFDIPTIWCVVNGDKDFTPKFGSTIQINS